MLMLLMIYLHIIEAMVSSCETNQQQVLTYAIENMSDMNS